MDKIRQYGHLPGGAKLAEWRNCANLTQFQLAVKIGIDPTVISAIENGNRSPHTLLLAAKIHAVTEGTVKLDDWVDWDAINADIIRRLPS